MVAAKVEYDSALTFDDLSRAIDVTESRVRDAVPAARLIYIEPDLRREPDTQVAHVGPDTSLEAD